MKKPNIRGLVLLIAAVGVTHWLTKYHAEMPISQRLRFANDRATGTYYLEPSPVRRVFNESLGRFLISADSLTVLKYRTYYDPVYQWWSTEPSTKGVGPVPGPLKLRNISSPQIRKKLVETIETGIAEAEGQRVPVRFFGNYAIIAEKGSEKVVIALSTDGHRIGVDHSDNASFIEARAQAKALFRASEEDVDFLQNLAVRSSGAPKR